MNYDCYTLDTSERRRYYIFSISLLAFVGYLFYKSAAAMLILAGAARFGEPYYCRYLSERRRRELSDQFRDFLYAISASVAAGRQMETAIEEAEQALLLLYQEQDCMCRELSHMVRAMKESNQPVSALLQEFAGRSGISDIEQFVEIYCVCETTGGNLESVIQKTVSVLLEKIDFFSEIEIMTAQKRFEANILAGISIGMIALLNVISPGYLQPLYVTLQGRVIMSAALAGIVAAYVWSIRLTRISLG